MRLMVCGASGMLGQRVVTEATARGHEVIASDLPDLNLTDVDAVRERLERERPDAVVNCAAFTDVDAAEDHEALALTVNADAAAHLARHTDYLVHVSTDYVFAGDATEPYVETSEPSPRTAYGRTKLAGERAVLDASAEHAVVRTAWLYGAGGKNFVDTILGLASGRDEIKVVSDQVGSPTWAGHLAPALLDIAERRGSGVFHATGEGSCSWHDLATAAVEASHIECRVLPCTTDEFPRPAPRPAYSVLASERADGVRLPPWRDGLAGHLSERVPA
jgi:dTDP-4-dehydrorhamnose reductase